jgi:hypothetical protein
MPVNKPQSSVRSVASREKYLNERSRVHTVTGY